MQLRLAFVLAAAALSCAACSAATREPQGAIAAELHSPIPVRAHHAVPLDIYADTRTGMLSPAVAMDTPMVYVPNSDSNTVTVIDPVSYSVVRTFRVGITPEHITPSWDLKTL